MRSSDFEIVFSEARYKHPQVVVNHYGRQRMVVGHTTCAIVHGHLKVAEGVALCSATEPTFSKPTGRLLAYKRALDHVDPLLRGAVQQALTR